MRLCLMSLKNDVECCSYYILNVVNAMKGIALSGANKHNDNDPIHYVFSGGRW